MRRLPYPDDLSDKEWSLLEKYIELDYSKGGRKPIHEKRNYLDAIFYWLRTGCGWRHLPHDFSPWIRIRYFEIPKYRYQGLVFGDKGYICKKLFDELYQKGLKLITRYRKNMKNKLALNEYDRQLLNQRNLVETVIDHYKALLPGLAYTPPFYFKCCDSFGISISCLYG